MDKRERYDSSCASEVDKQSRKVKLGITSQACQTKPPSSAQVESDSKMNANNSQQTIQKPKQRLLYYSSNSQNQTFLIFSGRSEPSAQPIVDFVPCLLATTYLQR